MNQRVCQPFFLRSAIWLLFAVCGCASPEALSTASESRVVPLWETPWPARRVAEALLPQGEWVTIARERHGSRELWRFVRRVLPDDLRTLVLDAEGSVIERRHWLGGAEVVQRGSKTMTSEARTTEARPRT